VIHNRIRRCAEESAAVLQLMMASRDFLTEGTVSGQFGAERRDFGA
jgi:hypothetical protein